MRQFLFAAALLSSASASATVFDLAIDPAVDNTGAVAELVAAINTANGNALPDTINLFAGGVYTLTVVNNGSSGNNALPVIGADGGNALTINGRGATLLRAAAAPTFRILHSQGTLTLDGITFSGAQGSGGFDGGGVRAQGGMLTVRNCLFTGNTTSGFAFGGAIGLRPNTPATITDCTFRTNASTSNGGAISGGAPVISNCTFNGNTAAANGGGVFADAGSGTVINCTFNGNSALNGGAVAMGNIDGASTLTVRNSTLAGNTATVSGGGARRTTQTLTLRNTIVAGNTAPVGPDISGSVTANFCLIGDTNGALLLAGSADNIPGPANLGPLADNGGPTHTMALPAGSAAVNAGDPAFVPPPAADQRGFPRIFNGRLDIGAFEVGVRLDGLSLAAAAISEGSLAALSGTFLSAAETAGTLTVDWGDGSATTMVNFAADDTGFGPVGHTYADNPAGVPTGGTFTITVAVTGTTESRTIMITVGNVAPGSITLTPSAASINENGLVTLSGNFFDPGTDDTHTVTVDWGDGSTTDSQNLAAGVLAFSGFSHTYLDNKPANAAYTVTVTVADKDMQSGTAMTAITVLNVAPSSVAVTPSSATINENAGITLSGSFADPGTLDTHSVGVDWGDGSATDTLNFAAGVTSYSGFSHTYPDNKPANAAYTVTVTVTDKDTQSGTGSTSVTVLNVNPTATLSNNGLVDEGQDTTVMFTGPSDPGPVDTAAGFHYAFDLDNNGSFDDGAGDGTYAGSSTTASATVPAVLLAGKEFVSVRAVIIDKDGGSTEYTTLIAVNAVAAPPAAFFAAAQDAGGGNVKLFRTSDNSLITTLTPFGAGYKQGVRVAVSSFLRDGDAAATNYLACASGAAASPKIKVYTDVAGDLVFSFRAEFQPFEPGMKAGIYPALGRLVPGGAGGLNVAVGTGKGVAPRVQVWSLDPVSFLPSLIQNANGLTEFAPFPVNHTGGVRVAFGPIDPDPGSDVLFCAVPRAAGATTQARVRLFTATGGTTPITDQTIPIGTAQGGLNMAVLPFAVAPATPALLALANGVGGPPTVRTFTIGPTGIITAADTFTVFNAATKTGVRLGATTLRPGMIDAALIAAPAAGGLKTVRFFDANQSPPTQVPMSALVPFPSFAGGVFVGY